MLRRPLGWHSIMRCGLSPFAQQREICVKGKYGRLVDCEQLITASVDGRVRQSVLLIKVIKWPVKVAVVHHSFCGFFCGRPSQVVAAFEFPADLCKVFFSSGRFAVHHLSQLSHRWPLFCFGLIQICLIDFAGRFYRGVKHQYSIGERITAFGIRLESSAGNSKMRSFHSD